MYGSREMQDIFIFKIQQQQIPVQTKKSWSTKNNLDTNEQILKHNS